MTISIKAHASTLVSVISFSLSGSGCAAKSEPPSVIMVTAPDAAATATATATAASPSPPVVVGPVYTSPPAPPASAEAPAPSSSTTASSVRIAPTAKPGKPKPVPRGKTITIEPIEGRPFIVDGQARVASLGASSAWSEAIDFSEAPMTPAQRAALIDHFTQWSLAEHASVASFARFGLQLLGLGAPPHLLLATTAAMQDEIRHARFGFGVVAALGSPIGPQALAIDGALEDDSLEHVLRLCVREGMIGETIAALELMASADLTPLPRLSRELASIGADEARHAELAYAFAAWALQRDPTLMAAIDEEISTWDRASADTAEGLEQWGIIGAAARRGMHREAFELAVRPLVERLRVESREGRKVHTESVVPT